MNIYSYIYIQIHRLEMILELITPLMVDLAGKMDFLMIADYKNINTILHLIKRCSNHGYLLAH
jgi:hypothetical protein